MYVKLFLGKHSTSFDRIPWLSHKDGNQTTQLAVFEADADSNILSKHIYIYRPKKKQKTFFLNDGFF